MLHILIALFLWSSAFVAGKYTDDMLDPVVMVQCRLLIAALIVFPLFKKSWQRVPVKLRSQVVWLSLINYPLMFMLQFIGLHYTSASSASTMIGLEPFLVVLVGHFFFGDKAQLHHWLFGAVAFGGIALLIYGGKQSGNVDFFGLFLVFASGLLFAASLRWTQKVVGQLSASVYTSTSIILGALLCIPFTLLLTDSWQVHWDLKGTLGLLYLGIGCSWLAFFLWNKGINNVNPNLAGILVSLEPVFAIFLAVLLLGEQINPLSWLGIVAVVSTTLLSSLYPRFIRRRVLKPRQ